MTSLSAAGRDLSANDLILYTKKPLENYKGTVVTTIKATIVVSVINERMSQ